MRKALLLLVLLATINCLTVQPNPTYSGHLTLEFDYAVT